MGSTSRVKDHPDGRAIFYEETTYSKRKIADFIVVLEGFKASLKIAEVFSACANDLSSRLLRAVTLQPSRGGEGQSLGLGGVATKLWGVCGWGWKEDRLLSSPKTSITIYNTHPPPFKSLNSLVHALTIRVYYSISPPPLYGTNIPGWL